MTEKRAQINVRLDQKELEKVKRSAEVFGLSVGQYVKKIVLHSKLAKPKFSTENQHEITRQFVGIANNLNQLTRIANTHHEIDNQQLLLLRKEVNELWQRLEK